MRQVAFLSRLVFSNEKALVEDVECNVMQSYIYIALIQGIHSEALSSYMYNDVVMNEYSQSVPKI